jgi:polyhydroxyalkanoate synthesis regulator phasin
MANKKNAEESPEQTNDNNEGVALIETLRKVLLASIGAFALGLEEVEAFLNKLVERGEIAEQDAKNLINEMKSKRKKDAKMAEEEINKRVEEVLKRMNVPTKTDIDSLSKKMTSLSKKLDEMDKSLEEPES